MGKTHLLNSIGLSLREKNKVMFISAERFMYHFIKSIKKNDYVIITAGLPFGHAKMTNMIRLYKVGT